MTQSANLPFASLLAAFRAGEITRRQFIERSVAFGMASGVALAITDGVAQEASPAATPDASPVVYDGVIPTTRTEGQTRGQGGELKILQWQAPSQMNGMVATGDKDNLAASLVQESLLVRLPDATLATQLAQEVPTLANGLVSEDLKSVTISLKEGLLWSDGEPVTAEDIKFTFEWGAADENGAVLQGQYTVAESVEVVDDLTVTVTYATPNPSWAEAFTGMGASVLLPKHILEGGGQEVNDQFRSKPIGTGPYKVESFSANDSVRYVINENYRDPAKPYFSTVQLKGGGDAAAAARASLQTGEYDFAWNLAAEPDLLRSMETPESPGVLVVYGGMTMERVLFNFSDPDTEVDGQRSEMNTPHPILSDQNVREAIVIGVNRDLIAKSFYFGPPSEPAVANALTGIPAMESPNTEVIFDQDRARALLDESGWVLDGDVRKKDGKELALRHYTTTSGVRQKIQAVIKANLEEIGFKITLEQVDSAIFFDSAAGNDQNNSHFYTDMEEFATSAGAPPPVNYMLRWYSGANGREIPQRSNGWTGRNYQRYQNPEYDALFEQAEVEGDPDKSAELYIAMNDILWNESVLLPLVRYGSKAGVSKRINLENLSLSNFEFSYWNIANWNLAEGAQ